MLCSILSFVSTAVPRALSHEHTLRPSYMSSLPGNTARTSQKEIDSHKVVVAIRQNHLILNPVTKLVEVDTTTKVANKLAKLTLLANAHNCCPSPQERLGCEILTKTTLLHKESDPYRPTCALYRDFQGDNHAFVFLSLLKKHG